MLKTIFIILAALLFGFGSGAVVSFLSFFTYSVVRHGGLW